MLSRDAEHLYWLARYIERAENTARMINVNVEMMLDFPVDDTLGWESIIESMDSKKDFHKIYSNFEESNFINFLSTILVVYLNLFMAAKRESFEPRLVFLINIISPPSIFVVIK